MAAMRPLISLALVLTALGAAGFPGAFAEPPPPPEAVSDWVSVDGPHLGYPDFMAAANLLATPSAMLQQQALDRIEAAIRSGGTSPADTNTVNLLAGACIGPGRIRPRPEPANPMPELGHPEVRYRAASLLALLGGDGARAALLEAMASEGDASVLCEMYRSLARLGTDIPAMAPAQVARHLRDPFPNGPNDGLIQEIARSCSASPSLRSAAVDPAVFSALLAAYQDRRYLDRTRDLVLACLKLAMGME